MGRNYGSVNLFVIGNVLLFFFLSYFFVGSFIFISTTHLIIDLPPFYLCRRLVRAACRTDFRSLYCSSAQVRDYHESIEKFDFALFNVIYLFIYLNLINHFNLVARTRASPSPSATVKITLFVFSPIMQLFSYITHTHTTHTHNTHTFLYYVTNTQTA